MSIPTDTPPLPLALVAGPKLAPFRGTATADIEFIRFVGDDNDYFDSKVWKVSINGKYFALKIFPFQYWKGKMKTMGKYITSREGDSQPPLTPQEYVYYMDSFNNECRVYGRLKQEKREDVAIRAHGYILITPEQEKEVTEAHGRNYVDPETQADLGDDKLDPDSFWQRRGCHRHERLRAIVKDFVDEGTPDFEKNQILQMHDDMESIHSLGILIRDIHAGNYLAGKLVDFSCAFTMYHPCLDRVQWHNLREWRILEPSMFKNMIVTWCYLHDTDIIMPKALEKWSGGIEDCGINPCDYDWRKWEADDLDVHGENKT